MDLHDEERIARLEQQYSDLLSASVAVLRCVHEIRNSLPQNDRVNEAIEEALRRFETILAGQKP